MDTLATSADTAPWSAEPAGLAFQRLSHALTDQRQRAAAQAAQRSQLEAEVAELEAQLATAHNSLASLHQAARASDQRCSQLQEELNGLQPRLKYSFALSHDASALIMGQLGKARCRAARACCGLRAAVAAAEHLGAFRHRVLAVAAQGCADGDEGEDGFGHTVVCTGDAVFCFGQGHGGELGCAAQATPQMAKGLMAHDVVGAATTEHCTLVCTRKGLAYWFGSIAEAEGVRQKTCVPTRVGGLRQVAGVAAGDRHLMAWTTTGELYTWGEGCSGQLGHGGEETEAAPTLVQALVGECVVGADGGFFHSVVRTASGHVYTCGSGRKALGHGQEAPAIQLTPRMVEALAGRRVESVAAGRHVMAAVTAVGELYTWGMSSFGALGHGVGEEMPLMVWVPRVVPGMEGKNFVGVVAGCSHMLAWTDSGELFSWGDGSFGKLGHSSIETAHSVRHVQALGHKKVVAASAGYQHSVVVTSDQEVYTFGLNASGQLGRRPTGQLGWSAMPLQVEGLRIRPRPLQTPAASPSK